MSAGSLVKAQRNISSHHHALAPHQRLPSGILAEIFVQCIPSVESGDIKRDYYMLDPFQACKPELCWMYPHLIRARLALVCRAWYTVLYNEPRVWSTIGFLVHLETVSLWIKRSKSVPLLVFIPRCRMELGLDNAP